MSPKKRLQVLSAIALVAVLGVFFWARLARHRAEAAIADVLQRRADLIAQARRLDTQRAATDRKATALRALLAAQPTAATPQGRADDPLRVLMNDPQLQASYFAARQANLATLYGPAFRALGLNAGQRTRLEALLLQRDEQFLDVIATVPNAAQSRALEMGTFSRLPFVVSTNSEDGQPLRGTTPETQAALALLRQTDDAFAQQAAVLLGGEGVAQLQNFERTLPLRDFVDDFGQSLAETPAALTPDQFDRLTQVLASASDTYQHGGTARGHLIYQWDQVGAQAAAILTPDQLAAFQAQIANPVAARQLRTAIREAGGFGELGKLQFAFTGRDD